MWMGRSMFGAYDVNVASLQSALVSLGKATGDPELKKIVTDGLIGPKTTSAVNRAFTTHIGSGQAPASYRTGTLTQDFVLSHAADLLALIGLEVKRRGGSMDVTPIVPVKPPVVYTPPYTPPATPPAPAADGISTTTWLAVGLGLAALGTVAYVFTQRRRIG